MQDKTELEEALAGRKQQAMQYALELERLKQQLAESRSRQEAAHQALDSVSAERDSAQHQVKILQSSQADTSPRALGRATAAAVSILALGALFTVIAFHDAQSNVKNKRQTEIAAINTQDNVRVVNNDAESAAEQNPASQANKGKSRFPGLKDVSQRQWGPPLLMMDAGTVKPHVVFDPLVQEIQENLLILGFDIGEADGFNGTRTRLAVAEFRALYMPDSGKHIRDTELVVIIRNYANLARADARKFGIDRGVVAAIRLSSVRTGVDFSYLMKLAAAESSFKPESEAASSSATGMYQFTHDTWLNTFKRHGTKYGMAEYAAKIEYYITAGGYRRPMVRDKAVYQHLLEVRKNPRISSMMAAELVRDNQQKLAYSFDRKPAQADLYLTHFLGSDGAISFLKALDENPDTFAVDMFPEAARSNYGIFHPKTCDPRTVDEVYELFGEKFNTRRYDEVAVN